MIRTSQTDKRKKLSGLGSQFVHLVQLFVVSLAFGLPAFLHGAPVSGSYSNVVSAQVVNVSKHASEALSRAGFIPAESFSNPSVALEGQSSFPRAYVQGSRCGYGFAGGLLGDIRRCDLVEDKGPTSLILPHLTNEVLALKTNTAPDRALAFLRALGYDADAIRKAYRISVHDDLMTAYPVRDGGPNFPKDLHFFGELISRKKIHIYVEFVPKNPEALATCYRPAEMEIEFLATSGELLAARLADPAAFAALGIRLPDLIGPIETPDFTPPHYFSASRKLAAVPANITSNDAVALVRQVWRELQEKMGTNRPQCYVISDNLNQPQAIAQEVAKLAGTTPWTGDSYFWRNDLPFERALMDQLARNRRGIGVMAICGRIHIQTEVLPNITGLSPSLNGQNRFVKERERLLPQINALLNRISPTRVFPDRVLFLFQDTPSFASYVACQEIESRKESQVFDITRCEPYDAIARRITYYNGAILTNALVVLALDGALPLCMDPQSVIFKRPARRIVSGEVASPVTEFAHTFGPHPMQELFDLLGPDLIELLRYGDRVEVFRVKGNGPDDWSVSGKPSIEGHEIIARSKPQGPEFATKLALLLNDKMHGNFGSSCIIQPQDAFRVWRGQASATLLVCFDCDHVEIKHYDRSGKLLRDANCFFGSNQAALFRLTRQALPVFAAAEGVKR